MPALRVAPPPARGLHGTLAVPGDKSIAHRALLLGALAEGTTVVRGFSGGADVRSTLGAVRALGTRAEDDGDIVRVHGRGLALGPAGEVAIDCGNSGTTMRLGAGLIAGGPGSVVLDGDASLRRRPMERVAEPLRAMGARVTTVGGHAPVTVAGGSLHGVEWTLRVASAQLKSAILLAGLRALGTTRVREPLASRDHTERLLAHMGARITTRDGAIEVEGGTPLRATEVVVPGDASSAAFVVVGALLVPGSDVRLLDVGLNPGRTGALGILRRMGAAIDVSDAHDVAGEPRGTLRARASALRATTIEPEEIPAAIDELPVLCVAAALAEGETIIRGAAELRLKESDRIAGLAQLGRLGVAVRTTDDGLVIRGTGGRPLAGGRIATAGDHRIAMAFAVAGLVAEGGVEIDDPECAQVSWPGFYARLADLGGAVEAP
jgi:3-phosphoshikimate 1-carboxyvinyltransferase